MPNLLKKFLGEERWRALWGALKKNSSEALTPGLGWDAFLVALLVAGAPVFITFADSFKPSHAASGTLPTMAFGICAVLALLVRSRLGLGFVGTPNWKASLSLTHTAVALGCIPAVFILLLSKTLLADRHDTLSAAVGGSGGTAVSFATKIALVLAIAAWVAVTEELIFRGLLVSVIRRLKFIPRQRHRDVLSAVLSAVIFGLAHWPTWGAMPALALTGLGLGFVAAYIANGEQLMPLVLYHFIFDALSITVSVGW